jgi:hypothetical protein
LPGVGEGLDGFEGFGYFNGIIGGDLDLMGLG